MRSPREDFTTTPIVTRNPVKKLARLPLEFSDELGRIIFLHPEKLLSYADVAQLRDGVLVLRRRCVVTALAQEAVSLRNVQLIKQGVSYASGTGYRRCGFHAKISITGGKKNCCWYVG
ncbi:propanediol utilization protein [Citrobacter freundii]|nr:propanediol utilization protein [Citrobacter freundii]